jgi:hypothetical protein
MDIAILVLATVSIIAFLMCGIILSTHPKPPKVDDTYIYEYGFGTDKITVVEVTPKGHVYIQFNSGYTCWVTPSQFRRDAKEKL